MKLERNGIVVALFGITFVILLLFSFLTSGFKFDIKGIFVAIYFAVWIAAVAFVLLTFILPFLSERKKEAKVKKTGTGPATGAIPTPFKSPRSGLPVRERIALYVAERRREDGLPAPEPLHPSRAGSSAMGKQPSAPPSAAAAAIPSSGTAPVSSAGRMEDNELLGDIPLPDDFGSVDASSGDMGTLPGLEDDFGDLGEFGGSDDMPPDFSEETSSVFIADSSDTVRAPPKSPTSEDLPDGGLPGFDGDIDSDLSESDLMPDDAMMDLSDDDVLTMDEESVPSSSSGELSEAGLPDLDDTLEPDVFDQDLSEDDDFGDIEFMDLEPEEPKKGKK